MSSSLHEFAFFLSEIDALIAGKRNGDEIIVKDPDLVHRLLFVVKLQPSDICIIFNHTIHAFLQVSLAHKKEFSFSLIKQEVNKHLSPHITLYLPLLKRTNLEEAVYNATECGVSEIELLITEKSVHTLSRHESSRLEKIIIAACEQAKYFTPPIIHPPKNHTMIFSHLSKNQVTIWLDPAGKPLLESLLSIQSKKLTKIGIIVGPEGDFTDQEKKELSQLSLERCSLTQTILRSTSAVTIGIASIRALQ